ncbi:MBL fold metallo-hydrolase [Skermania piniformis]|uniref:MBL fold metallo-hydrolase n=1 Tax=Skermania pinensis TaxID=39122 RepID=A0ABX8S7N8_9ACTN|nr:MBL fold metallo-hydrolase [Skermania piniformis]QXQ13481.1 MBL fold metallo-hydrolase [Skermania piniformis]
MRLAHFRHSCLLVELDGTRVLFDPGIFSHGFEGLTGLDAIVVTHQHPDHCDPARIPDLVAANPDATLLADPQTAAQLGPPWVAFHPGAVRPVGSVQLTAGGGRHAVIHPDIPVIDNTAVLVGTTEHPGRLLHPGDSLWVPSVPVDVLAIPAAAPWLKISETVDYLRSVAPRVAVPIHQAIVAADALPIFYGRLSEMAPDVTEFRAIGEETTVDVG